MRPRQWSADSADRLRDLLRPEPRRRLRLGAAAAAHTVPAARRVWRRPAVAALVAGVGLGLHVAPFGLVRVALADQGSTLKPRGSLWSPRRNRTRRV